MQKIRSILEFRHKDSTILCTSLRQAQAELAKFLKNWTQWIVSGWKLMVLEVFWWFLQSHFSNLNQTLLKIKTINSTILCTSLRQDLIEPIKILWIRAQSIPISWKWMVFGSVVPLGIPRIAIRTTFLLTPKPSESGFLLTNSTKLHQTYVCYTRFWLQNTQKNESDPSSMPKCRQDLISFPSWILSVTLWGSHLGFLHSQSIWANETVGSSFSHPWWSKAM